MDPLDPEAIDAGFAATQPRRGTGVVLQAALLVGIFAAMFLPLTAQRTGVGPEVGLALPPLIVAVALVLGIRAGRRRRICRDGLIRAWQHLQLEEPEAALEALDDVLTRPIASDSDRGQAFITLAGAAERLGRFDSAGHIYESLLSQRVGDISHLQEAQIKLAYAKVRSDELTDAVNLISRLAQVNMPPPLKAAFDLVQLFQQVFMGHFADAVQQACERRASFRKYLSTRAGLGYGLLAAACHQVGQHAEASALWRDATTLIRCEKLVREYPLLAQVAGQDPGVEHPI